MSPPDEGPGLLAAVSALKGMREEWSMDTLIGYWTTPNGEIAIVVDADGHDLFNNDEPVPRLR